MTVFSFPYHVEIEKHIFTHQYRSVFRPKIPVFIRHNQTTTDNAIAALLDSGADFNLFPADIAKSLGMELTKGISAVHIGIGGIEIPAYQHQVVMKVQNYEFVTTIDFSEAHKFPLLGRSGFFRFFKKIAFEETARNIFLEL